LPVHHGENGFRDVHDSEEVGFNLGPEVFVGDLLDGCGICVAGIVDHHVDPAEGAEGGVDGIPRRGSVDDVEASCPDQPAVLVD